MWEGERERMGSWGAGGTLYLWLGDEENIYANGIEITQAITVSFPCKHFDKILNR